jgi:hypothetical protein
MRQLIFILCFAIAAPLAAQVYRWVDENGVVHYSDVPREGAEQIELQQPTTFSAPEISTPSATEDEGIQEEGFSGYASFDIKNPSAEETIWNTAGQVTVALDLQPRLRTGHTVRLYLDGNWLEEQPDRQTTFPLTELARGSHNVRADVRNENGVVQTQTGNVVFYVQQTSVNSPARGPR